MTADSASRLTHANLMRAAVAKSVIILPNTPAESQHLGCINKGLFENTGLNKNDESLLLR